MSTPARSGDVVADIVADVVQATRRGTAVYCRARLHAPWGMSVQAGEIASIHVITAGACWLVAEGCRPVQLTCGDVALVPGGLGHALVDSPGRATRPIEELIGMPLGQVPSAVALGGDGPVTEVLCGGFMLADGPRHPLTDVLPSVVRVSAGRSRGTGLAAAVELLSTEAERSDPGAPAVVASLVDLLFVYVLRTWLAEQGQACPGWVSALRDPVVGGALALVHGDPARPWSVVALARAVGAPRATFSRRFTALTGQSPMAYVTSWRMAVAARLLREQQAPVREVARRVGYDSEFAFARAFKRVIGQAPGRYRAAAREPS